MADPERTLVGKWRERTLVGKWREACGTGTRRIFLETLLGAGDGPPGERLLRLFAVRLADDATRRSRDGPPPEVFDAYSVALRQEADGADVRHPDGYETIDLINKYGDNPGVRVFGYALGVNAWSAAVNAAIAHADDGMVEAKDRVDLQGYTLVAMVAPGRTWDPAWGTSATVALAASMYEADDYSAAPILADALQEAGCDDGVMLDRLRDGSWAFPGCWVVDNLLKKR